MYEIELSGLDGGSLLGFLAAMGVLRVLAAAAGDEVVRLRWRRAGAWVPVVMHSATAGAEELLDVLEARTCGEQTADTAWGISKDLTLSREEFGNCLEVYSKEAGATSRGAIDFLAAFGSEAFGSGPKKDQMSDTAFRTMSGAGHQHFLGFMRELAEQCGREHLRRSLFQIWDYGDGRPSLRWDPADYRPHALRAEDPSGDPIKTMRGANRLAVEALPLFPTAPCGRKVRTVGFNNDGEISWPIWLDPLDVSSVSSLLASEEIQSPDRSAANRRGIVQVLRARRFTEGKYRNFSPARELL